MMKAEPWQKAEIPGPKKALIITKPEVVVAMIKRAKRPILVAGSKTVEIEVDGEKLIDYIIKLSKAGKIPVVATAHSVGEFLKRGFKPDAFMSVLDIANRLRDHEWTGLDGGGQYDLALFAGMQYYIEWLILSGLKHYAGGLTTLTLDGVYHPHASWSFPTLPKERWIQNLKVIIEKLEEGV